jgi:hypothetical protein
VRGASGSFTPPSPPFVVCRAPPDERYRVKSQHTFSLRSLGLTALLSLASALGCGGATPKPVTDTPKTEPTAAAAAATAPTEAEAPEAEEAEAPAATFDQLQKEAMACDVDEDGAFDANSCAAYTAWLDAEQPAFEGGKSNAALVKMLASSEPKARLLAAERLQLTLDETNLDAATADALLAAAEKERQAQPARALAELIAGLDLAKIGKIERAVAVVKGNADLLAASYLVNAGPTNRDKALLAYVKEASASPSSYIRDAALQSAYYLTGDFGPEACKLVDAARADKDASIAGRATGLLADAKTCGAHFDKLLDSLSAVDVKKDVPTQFGVALQKLCGRKDLTDKQRTRAIKAAKRISDAAAAGANAKYYTLSAVMRCDPKDGKAYVEKFKNEKDKATADRAADLTR